MSKFNVTFVSRDNGGEKTESVVTIGLFHAIKAFWHSFPNAIITRINRAA